VIEVSSFQGIQLSRCFPSPHLRTERDPVSETSCFLVSRIQEDGKVQKPNNSECYTPSSEPFRIYSLTGVDFTTPKEPTYLRFFFRGFPSLSQTVPFEGAEHSPFTPPHLPQLSSHHKIYYPGVTTRLGS
jgi:hypothetical protein